MHRGNGPRGSLWLLLLAVCLHPGARAEAPKGGWTEAESSLKKAVQTGSVSAAKRIIADLARTGDPRGIELIVQNSLDAGHAEIYAQAAGWLRELKEPALRRVVCGALEKGSSYRARIVLVAVIGSWKEDPAALDALLRLLGDPRKEVIFAALQRIRDFQQPDRSLPALIAELEKREKRKHDRVYFDIRRTLEHLSGHDFDVAADWKNYWSALQSGIKIPERKKEGVTQLYKPASFFTVSVESDRVAFLIDISG
ncbi:MAG: hypothetical protein JXA90_03395, partial [Planctomycetes bacterium]|nr:hypothetical protein [Planctomycetota bacterium]